jgi:hypothetical protein
MELLDIDFTTGVASIRITNSGRSWADNTLEDTYASGTTVMALMRGLIWIGKDSFVWSGVPNFNSGGMHAGAIAFSDPRYVHRDEIFSDEIRSLTHHFDGNGGEEMRVQYDRVKAMVPEAIYAGELTGFTNRTAWTYQTQFTPMAVNEDALPNYNFWPQDAYGYVRVRAGTRQHIGRSWNFFMPTAWNPEYGPIGDYSPATRLYNHGLPGSTVNNPRVGSFAPADRMLKYYPIAGSGPDVAIPTDLQNAVDNEGYDLEGQLTSVYEFNVIPHYLINPQFKDALIPGTTHINPALITQDMIDRTPVEMLVQLAAFIATYSVAGAL